MKISAVFEYNDLPEFIQELFKDEYNGEVFKYYVGDFYQETKEHLEEYGEEESFKYGYKLLDSDFMINILNVDKYFYENVPKEMQGEIGDFYVNISK